ncbi:hypothetical protein EYS10_06350 [Rahnella aquatilis]|nr:hypothetical protein EYS10_06350 [Rahnella aquatilis]
MEEYKKNCEDELDWVIVNQLHEATLQISKSCFEFKKICVGLLGVILTVLVKLTDGRVDDSYFFIPLLICLGFWIADFSAYYFQRKTREVMSKKLEAIASRNYIVGYQPDKLTVSWCSAAFNHSMCLYYVLAIIGCGGWIIYYSIGK